MVPNSSFVSARMRPRDSARAAANPYTRKVMSRIRSRSSLPTSSAAAASVRLVVPGLGLGRGREHGLGKALGLLQTGRHRPAVDRAPVLVLGPRRAEQIPAPDALEPHGLRRPHEHRTPCDVGPRRLGEVRGVRGDQVVGCEAGGLLEPERRQRGERPALVGNEVFEHHVEHRDAVRRDDQHAVVVHVVEIADLPGIRVRQRDARHGRGVEMSRASTARPA